MKFYCIADEDTVRGFRLAGVDGQAVSGAPEAAGALERAAERGYGVLILTRSTALLIRAQVEAFRWERSWPLIVEIPGPQGALPGYKSLRRFVEEAVGVSVKE